MFASNKKLQLPFDPEVFKCDSKIDLFCANKTAIYRERILSQFKSSMIERNDDETNVYHVEYEHPNDTIKYNPTCMVLDAKLRLLTKNDSPFDANKIGRLFPQRTIFDDEDDNDNEKAGNGNGNEGDETVKTKLKSCVIVSSAGSLFRSGLGKFIGKTRIRWK